MCEGNISKRTQAHLFAQWFQVFFSYTDCSIQNCSFVNTQLNNFKYDKRFNGSIWPMNGTLISITTPTASGGKDRDLDNV